MCVCVYICIYLYTSDPVPDRRRAGLSLKSLGFLDRRNAKLFEQWQLCAEREAFLRGVGEKFGISGISEREGELAQGFCGFDRPRGVGRACFA